MGLMNEEIISVLNAVRDDCNTTIKLVEAKSDILRAIQKLEKLKNE